MSFDPQLFGVIEENIQEHVAGIPVLIGKIFPQMKKVWKFTDDFNFVYGWYIGRLECHAQHIFFDNMGRWPEGEELLEIKEMIEVKAKEIREKISENFAK